MGKQEKRKKQQASRRILSRSKRQQTANSTVQKAKRSRQGKKSGRIKQKASHHQANARVRFAEQHTIKNEGASAQETAKKLHYLEQKVANLKQQQSEHAYQREFWTVILKTLLLTSPLLTLLFVSIFTSLLENFFIEVLLLLVVYFLILFAYVRWKKR